METLKWDYKGIHTLYDMNGVIKLPNNSEVMVVDWINELPEFMKQADTIFVDPPWNIGNVNTFYTKAAKQHFLFDFDTFSGYLFQRIDEISPADLFIEIGKEFLGKYLVDCKLRYKYVTFYNSTYYHKKENKCYVIHATNNSKLRRYKNLEDVDEQKIIEWICLNHPYNCIGDLCMGTGLVGRYAYDAGKRFVGTELNAKRLALLVHYINTGIF